VRIQSYPRNGN